MHPRVPHHKIARSSKKKIGNRESALQVKYPPSFLDERYISDRSVAPTLAQEMRAHAAARCEICHERIRNSVKPLMPPPRRSCRDLHSSCSLSLLLLVRVCMHTRPSHMAAACGSIFRGTRERERAREKGKKGPSLTAFMEMALKC